MGTNASTQEQRLDLRTKKQHIRIKWFSMHSCGKWYFDLRTFRFKYTVPIWIKFLNQGTTVSVALRERKQRTLHMSCQKTHFKTLNYTEGCQS